MGKWEEPEGEVCVRCVKLNMFACHRAHCLLTVRRGSSVEEQLSWSDCNGKHEELSEGGSTCVDTH